jgi:hypothetical protein
MRRLPGLIVLVLALAIPAVGATAAPSAPQPATAHAAKAKSCRTPFTESRTAQGILVSGVSCPAGVKVAVAVSGKTPSGCVKADKRNHVKLVSPCVRRGFRCTSTPHMGGLVLNALCKRGSSTIRFQY